MGRCPFLWNLGDLGAQWCMFVNFFWVGMIQTLNRENLGQAPKWPWCEKPLGGVKATFYGTLSAISTIQRTHHLSPDPNPSHKNILVPPMSNGNNSHLCTSSSSSYDLVPITIVVTSCTGATLHLREDLKVL